MRMDAYRLSYFFTQTRMREFPNASRQLNRK